ncbi:MAG: hypothetical protein N3E37_04320 [Candidatus Micrarchaeota archaeon]|nr:hypothetical protein [Candidatus Micrarchaeota archaeon]
MKIREVIRQISNAFQSENIKELKQIVSIATYNLGTKRDKNYLLFGILAYSLSKLLQKESFYNLKDGYYYNNIKDYLNMTKHMSNENEISKICEKIISLIIEFENFDKKFAKSIVQKAKLKIGATLYAQGFSLSTASELSEENQDELMTYIGNTLFADRLKESKDINERLNQLSELLN